MKLLLLLLVALSAWAGVWCEDASGNANGTGWNGTTCAGAVRPVFYRVQNDGETEADIRTLVQRVVDDAYLGDTIRFRAGDDFNLTNGSNTGVFVSRRPGTGELVLTSTEEPKLPPSGTRITPAYKPLMPRFPSRYQSPVFMFQTGPAFAENITFRGLYFDVHAAPDGPGGNQPNPNLTFVHGFIRIGGNSSNGYNATNDIVTQDFQSFYARTTGSTPAGPTVVLPYVTGLEVGMRMLNGNGSGATAPWTITAIDEGTKTVTVTPNVSSFNASSIFVWSSDGRVPVAFKPRNIKIERCVMVNQQHKWQVNRFVSNSGRNTTIRDSFMGAPLSTSEGSSNTNGDTQVIAFTPNDELFTLENNYLDGGSETLMGGDGFSASDLGGATYSGLFRYNWLGHIPERDYTSVWNMTQDDGVFNGAAFITKTSSPLTLPGLAANSPRLVFSGRHITAPTATGVQGGTWYRARNTGVVGTTAPPFASLTPNQEVYDVDPARTNPSVYGQTWCKGDALGNQSADTLRDGDGVCWRATDETSAHPLIKNNFELKHGRDITMQYNVFDWFGSMHQVNASQAYMFVLKTSNSGACNPVPSFPWFPACYASETRNISVYNNIFRGFSGGIIAVGTVFSTYDPLVPSRNGGYRFKHNLFVQTERPHVEATPEYRWFRLSDNALRSGNEKLPDVEFDHNTFASTFVGDSTAVQRIPFQLGTSTNAAGGFDGVRSMVGNIFHRWMAGSVQTADANAGDYTTSQSSWFPGTATGGVWGKNIVLGARQDQDPSGNILSMCDSIGQSLAAACITSSSHSARLADMQKALFVKHSFDGRGRGGAFWLQRNAPGKYMAADGKDLGADMSQLPEIRQLQVAPADTRVVFRFSVTQPIAHIPCVVEVHTSPDFESDWHGTPASYAGDLATIASHYGKDSSAHPRNPQRGLQRSILIENLTASTWYAYRLHCGGDVQRGSFTSLSAVAGTKTHTVRFTGSGTPSVAYGTGYDRSTDTISGGGTAAATCSSGRCAASFEVTRGPLYVRIPGRPVAPVMVR